MQLKIEKKGVTLGVFPAAVDERVDCDIIWCIDLPHCEAGSTISVVDSDEPGQVSDGQICFVRVKQPQSTPKSLINTFVGICFALSISMVVMTGGLCISYAMIIQTLAKATAL